MLALRPGHGIWQVADMVPRAGIHPGRGRLPLKRWRRLVLTGSHGRPLVRYAAGLELGPCCGSARGTRLIAATAGPTALRPGPAWFMAASFPVAEADAAGACRICRLRDRIGHSCEPARHELGRADFQVRSEKAIVRHWQLVMPAFTFSLLAAAPADQAGETATGNDGPARGKSATADHLAGHAAAGPQLAVPLGTPAAAPAPLADRPATPATGGAA